jgi:hypothetical protein
MQAGQQEINHLTKAHDSTHRSGYRARQAKAADQAPSNFGSALICGRPMGGISIQRFLLRRTSIPLAFMCSKSRGCDRGTIPSQKN